MKNWVLLSCVLLLGSAGNSEATPLDSPDVVYIDGLPCNSLCQSYMAWSRQSSSMPAQRARAQPELVPPKAAARREMAIRGERAKRAVRLRVANPGAASSKLATPNSSEMPHARIAGLQPKDKAATDSEPAPEKIVDPQPAADAANTSGPAQARIADSHPTHRAAAASNTRTPRDQVTAATAVAERLTVADAVSAPESNADHGDRTDHQDTVSPGDVDITASARAIDPDLLVALVMARPEIQSVSDLANKNIAIDGEPSASNGSVRTAIVAAGAAEVQLSKGEAKAIDRVIGGEVPAAVLTLVSPEAAEGFPDVEGFRIFRIPLSPKARL
jgi:hypothetical protein